VAGERGSTRSTAVGAAAARRIVEARLGRPAQDMLEAAVVLEAWGGMSSSDALAAGRALMEESRPDVDASAGSPPRFERGEQYAFESAAFVIAVLAIACWTGSLAERVSPRGLEIGLTVALPFTLTLQWWLRSRYLGRPRGLTLLGTRLWIVPAIAIVLVAAPTAVLGSAGLVAGLLTLVWTSGTILVRRHWSIGYLAAIMLATGVMAVGLDPLVVLGVTAAATTLAAVPAVRRPGRRRTGVRPGRWFRAATAAAIGGCVGVLLVADRTAGWGTVAVPALSLLPSAVASLWAGRRLWRFQEAIPEALCGIPAGERERAGIGPALRILLEATGRLLCLTAVLSVLLVLVAPLLGIAISAVGVLVGFGLVALATLLVSLLEAVARPGPALGALGCGILAEVLVQTEDLVGFAGGGLVVGASLATTLAAPAAVVLLRRPATTLATSLWIP
jgi:hypothetical protein